ncbi:ROK family protein [Amphibacillus sp. Q70]|uniref:ROK family protein n=1 Tax=Amphibacillus sp. Q70 TaxID=3453416 RepID=UPI003F8745BC
MMMYLVIDIGGTFTKYAVMSIQGEILKDEKVLTPKSSIDELIHLIDRVYGEQNQNIEGIAISLPGTVDVENGVIYYGGSLPYLHNQNLVELVTNRCKVPVSIENDGKCAALAEHWKGSTKGFANSIVLVLGTGVGGGIFIENKLLRGANLSAGEMSYIIDEYHYETTSNQMVGRSCSATMMINKIVDIKGLSENDGHSAFEYIKNNDPEVLPIFKEYCCKIAVQILNLQYILDPDIIALGGGISVQPILLEEIEKQMDIIKGAMELSMADPILKICQFRNVANLVGALYHHLLQNKLL